MKLRSCKHKIIRRRSSSEIYVLIFNNIIESLRNINIFITMSFVFDLPLVRLIHFKE